MSKVNINIEFNKVFKKIEKDIKKSFLKDIKSMFVSFIKKGISPVSGRGRFQDYSQSYKEQIRNNRYRSFGKRLRPINLTLSGKMLRSLKVRPTSKGITLFFSDKKADYHNKGMGNLPRRALMPFKNEKLSRVILSKIEKDVAKVVKDSFK